MNDAIFMGSFRSIRIYEGDEDIMRCEKLAKAHEGVEMALRRHRHSQNVRPASHDKL